MPKYNRTVKTPGKTAVELYEQVSKDIDRFLAKIESAPLGKIEVDRLDHERIVVIESKLFSAKLICLDGQLDLDVQLSLFAAPFRSKLDSGIDQWLEKRFGIRAESS